MIGIDLGTSNSAAAVLRGGRPVIIPSAEGISVGGKAFPSYVAVTPDGQMLIGEPARRQATANPEGTASAFKRRMGKRENIRLGSSVYTPEHLSAFLLQKIKRDAEAFLGEPVEKALAPLAGIRTEVEVFLLVQANMALDRLRRGGIRGAAVLVP